jgi:hypothetical protein
MYLLVSRILFLSLLIPALALGSSISVPERNFTIEVQGKYGSQWIKIYKDKTTWACQTSDLPYFEPKGNPLNDLDWKKLATESEHTPADCRDRVLIFDTLEKTRRKIATCSNLPETKRWLDVMFRRCSPL